MNISLRRQSMRYARGAVAGSVLIVIGVAVSSCGEWAAEPRFRGSEIKGTIDNEEIHLQSRSSMRYRPNATTPSASYRLEIDDFLIGFPDDEPGTYDDDNIYVRFDTTVGYERTDLAEIWCDDDAAQVTVLYREHDLIAGTVKGDICQSYGGSAKYHVDLEFAGTVTTTYAPH